MENSKYLPEPFRIRVIGPVERIARAYHKEAIIKSGMNPFPLDSEDVSIDLLTDSGTGAVTQSMQAAIMYDDEAYSGSHSYYALAELVKNIFGYRYTIPTRQSRGVEQIYIPVSTKKCEQEKGLGHSKMTAFPNHFFDTTQGYSQTNGRTACNVYIKKTFDMGAYYDFKGNFDLEGLERGIEEVGPNNVPYIAAAITSNSMGGQSVSLASSKAIYSIAKKYDIPVVMDSVHFAENAYFIRQCEAEYRDQIIEQIIRETYKYVDTLTMSAKKGTMVPMDGLLRMKDDSFFNIYTECRILCVVQGGLPTYGGLEGGTMGRLAVSLYNGMNFGQLAYRIAQTQCLVNDLEKIGVVCQQAGGHTTFVDVGKLLPHVPADQFPVQALACELYKVIGIRAIEVGSSLLGRDPKTDKQLPRPAELLRLTIPHVTYTQTYMDFIIGAFKHVRENAANIEGLTFTCEPEVLHHFTAKLKEA